jgi:hypothetical protein
MDRCIGSKFFTLELALLVVAFTVAIFKALSS